MRRFLLIAVVPLVVACAGPAGSTSAPVSVGGPAAAVTAPKPESQPAAQPTAQAAAQAAPKPAASSEPKPAAQEKPRPDAKPQVGDTAPAGAAELGRQFMQALIAGDTGAASALLSDSARSGLGTKLPDYARALAACAGSDLDADATQNQSMTNVHVRFAPPCGRAGDIIPLLPPGAVDQSQAEAKIGSCLVAFRSANGALRVANFACIPA